MRRIWGPVKENDRWIIRYNNELYKLYHKPRISAVVELRRLQWAGQTQCMDSKHMQVKVKGKSTL